MKTPRFDAVDQHDAPACIAFLDAAHASSSVQAIKRRSYELLHPREDARILDVGCGTGEDAWMLAAHIGGGGHVVGVDRSQAMIDTARSRAHGRETEGEAAGDAVGRVSFEQADIHALPFPDGHFDGCRADRILHLLDDSSAALAEMARVTRFGGAVVTSEPDWHSLRIDGGDDAIGRDILAFARQHAGPGSDVGARLTAMYAQAGLDVEIDLPEQVVINDVSLGFRLFSLGDHACHAVRNGVISGVDARRWFESLTRAAAANAFTCSLTGHTVMGIRR